MSGERVLVTGGDEIAVLGALRGLRLAGYEPWAAVEGQRSYAARSRAVSGTIVVPSVERNPDTFGDKVILEANRLSVAAVVVGTEAGLLALAGRQGGFPPGIAFGVPAVDIVRRATDKNRFLAIAEAAGLCPPPTTHVRLRDIKPGADRFPSPAVVKPLRSDSSVHRELRHTAPVLADGPDDLRAAVAAMPNCEALVQPYLPGEIYGVCGVASDGKVVCSLHQIGRRIWPADCGMVTYAETVPRDTSLDERVAHLVRELRWRGIFQLQLLRREERLYAIDFNPRPYISLALATAAGMNLTAIWVELLLGRKPTSSRYREGVRWRSDPDDPRALLRALVSGERTAALRGFLPRRRTTHAVFSWRDPAPLLGTIERLAQRVMRGG